MEKHSQVLYGLDIVNILDEYVQEFQKKEWKDDECPPNFKVSLYNEDMNNQQILITVTHLGNSFTNILFPRKNTEYGYETLENMMINMYNQTM
jgi:hypothetical protein